jgi:hypothetical protein
MGIQKHTMTQEDLVEIVSPNGGPLDRSEFLQLMETLTRIGIPSKHSNTLYQSCHLLHKAGQYYICHFKERFALDGQPTNFSEDDRARRNSIALLLEKFGLCKIVDPEKVREPRTVPGAIKVIKFGEKASWRLVKKYKRWDNG